MHVCLATRIAVKYHLQGHMDSLAAAERVRESDTDLAALFVLPVARSAVDEDPSQSFGRSVGKESTAAPLSHAYLLTHVSV